MKSRLQVREMLKKIRKCAISRPISVPDISRFVLFYANPFLVGEKVFEDV